MTYKTFYTCALALILNLGVKAQSDNCTPTLKFKITAPSGMRMRMAPNLKSKPVTSVPFDSIVKGCSDNFGALSYDKINGFWRRVYYNGKAGYMFDGYLALAGRIETETSPTDQSLTADSTSNDSLTAQPSVEAAPLPIKEKKTEYQFVTEAYNYCGDIKKLDPGLIWYGFYPQDEKQADGLYRINPVELEIVMSKYSVGSGLEFDVSTDRDERSIFLLGLNKPLEYKKLAIADKSQQLRNQQRKVFPGQEFTLVSGEKPVKLSATGSVVSSGPCPELKDYTLTLSGEKYFLPISQDLTQELKAPGACGMPEIYWYGDFTGDGMPEIIFVSVYDETNKFTLFISDPESDNTLLKKHAEWVIDKCY